MLPHSLAVSFCQKCLETLFFFACSEDKTIQFVGLASRIWLRRNEVLHGGTFTHPCELVLQTIRVVEEYKQVQLDGMSI